MVHASLRAIGPVVGGAAGVVEALEQAVGSTGTLLMNLGARDAFDWVNARPEPERVALLADAPPFDKDTTPADPDVGVLAEVFRELTGTVVNDHPDARFGARGRGARLLMGQPLPGTTTTVPARSWSVSSACAGRCCDWAPTRTP